MIPFRRPARCAALAFALALAVVGEAAAQAPTQPNVLEGRPYAEVITREAAANGVPVELVHRVIMRESKYRADLVGRGGTIGLMQIKLGTARGLGYSGSAEGLRDPATNLTHGIRYLAGAYRTAGGHHGRAVAYYAGGYYYAAKRQRRMPVQLVPVLAGSGAPAEARAELPR
jgi:soluble lytic murein transglycosylase-like protein